MQGYGSEIGDALTPHPRRPPHQLHRIGAHRQAHRRLRPPEPHPHRLRSRRQVTAVGVLPPTPTSTWAAVDLAVECTTIAQVRLAATRILVEEPIAEEFTRRFTEKAAGIQQGDLRD